MSIVVRAATRADLDHIVDYNFRLARETENKTLERSTLARGVEAVLDDAALGRYFVAQTGGSAPAGQLLITYEWSDWRNGMFWWLQSVYVAPEHRRSGVFSALYAHVLAAAREATNVCGIRLYVERENCRAASTYRALGFRDAGYQVMETELGAPRLTPES